MTCNRSISPECRSRSIAVHIILFSIVINFPVQLAGADNFPASYSTYSSKRVDRNTQGSYGSCDIDESERFPFNAGAGDSS